MTCRLVPSLATWAPPRCALTHLAARRWAAAAGSGAILRHRRLGPGVETPRECSAGGLRACWPGAHVQDLCTNVAVARQVEKGGSEREKGAGWLCDAAGAAAGCRPVSRWGWASAAGENVTEGLLSRRVGGQMRNFGRSGAPGHRSQLRLAHTCLIWRANAPSTC